MKILFLLCFVFCSINSWGFSDAGHDSCITDSIRRPISPYFSMLFNCDSNNRDVNISAESCDTSEYEIFSLFRYELTELILLKAKMEVTGGKVGDDFSIFEKSGDSVKLLNTFTGYLDCIKRSSGKYPDIIFYDLTDYGRTKVLIGRKGKYYHREKVLDVEGTNVTKRNKKRLLKYYNAINESHDIEKW